MYYVDDGCKDDGGNEVVASLETNSFLAGVRCCVKDSTGVSCITDLSCDTDKMSYDDAVAHCKGLGRRLCTKDELLDDICCETGGGCDTSAVWTSTYESGILLYLYDLSILRFSTF